MSLRRKTLIGNSRRSHTSVSSMINDAFTFLANKFLWRLRKRSFARNNQYGLVNVPKSDSIYSMTHPTHNDTRSAYAALDIIFIYLKVNITNIYINKYMPMLLKINLVDRCFWIQNARLFIRERDVYFQSIGLWLNFIRMHFLLTLIDIFTNAALHWNVFYRL